MSPNPVLRLFFATLLSATTLLAGCALIDGLGGESDPPIIINKAYSLSAGNLHTCALRHADTYFVCWGDDLANQLGKNQNAYAFSAVQAGDAHTCAIKKSDSTLTCWGNNEDGQSSPPADLAFQSIAAGYANTCGIRKDNGHVHCWGWEHLLSPPENVAFQSLALEFDHACGIRADDKIHCWSKSLEAKSIGNTPTKDHYKSVSTGNDFTCGVRKDNGTIVCWGDQESDTTRPPVNVAFYEISSSESRTCGITKDASIRCWGDGVDKPHNPPTTGIFSTVTVGREHACAVQVTNKISKVVCWGDNTYGQLNVPDDL